MLLLEHTCAIDENQAVGTNGRKQLAQVSASVRCLILPMPAAASVQNGYTVGKAYDAYFATDETIKVGQRLRWNGRELMVRAVIPYMTAFAGHIHALCTEAS